ncbi:hypothetical protein TRICI_006035 [Trichomonascus ciferrii]|uniref:Uncharacterized protein n=1 Tax=Trichomonascus ciferrii TaxID=44093 RepID=A0A642UMF8_9ASCO|nr:hypothetical protein TRICI_006035 [Trichomonascus ciferrii]
MGSPFQATAGRSTGSTGFEGMLTRYFGLLPSEVENARGGLVLIAFKESVKLSSMEGRLYNIDPTTGSVVLCLDDSTVRVIPNHSILKLTSKFSIAFLRHFLLIESVLEDDWQTAKVKLNEIDSKLPLKVTKFFNNDS